MSLLRAERRVNNCAWHGGLGRERVQVRTDLDLVDTLVDKNCHKDNCCRQELPNLGAIVYASAIALCAERERRQTHHDLM